MFKSFTVAAAIVAVTNADGHLGAAGEIFKWNKNNHFSTDGNWENDVVATGVADFSAGCVGEFGTEGGTVFVDANVAIGGFVMADNMELIFEDGVEVDFEDSNQDVENWRCKGDNEYLTTCSDNFLMKNAEGWAQADTAPCFKDTVQFTDNTVFSLMWGAGQHIRQVDKIDATDNIIQSFNTTDSIVAAMKVNRASMFQGGTPAVGDKSTCGGNAVACQMTCSDVCPTRDLALAVQDRDDFFSLPEETRNKVIEDVRVSQDAVNTIRFDATEAFNAGSDKLKEGTADLQTAYDAKQADAGLTPNDEGFDATIAEMTLTAADMANMMGAENVGTVHDVHSLRHSCSKDCAEKTVDFFQGVPNGAHFYGTEAEPETYKAMQLDTDLWTAIDAKGTVRDSGRKARMAHTVQSFSSVSDFILADANKVLAAISDSGATIVSFNGPTAVAADDSLDFGSAAGGFKITDVVMRGGSTYINLDGDHFSGVAPETVAVAISASMTRMAMFTRSEALRLAIHFRPTTTWSPTTSPTLSPTQTPSASPTLSPTASADFLAANLIPIAAGGGGFLLLVILIVVICVVATGGGSKGDKGEKRNVVAFENPMYDDPAQTNAGNLPNAGQDQEDGGLYDEPTFDSAAAQNDKENPMYQSNEDVIDAPDVGGGYLDVEPDDAESDEEGNDDEEEDDEDDEDE